MWYASRTYMLSLQSDECREIDFADKSNSLSDLYRNDSLR